MNTYYGVIKKENNALYNCPQLDLGYQTSAKKPENTVISCRNYTEYITWFNTLHEAMFYKSDIILNCEKAHQIS